MDRPFPPTFRIMADINLTGNGYRIQQISGCPAFGTLHLTAAGDIIAIMWRVLTRLLHGSIVASFSGAPPPRPTAKTTRGEGRGEGSQGSALRWTCKSVRKLGPGIGPSWSPR